MNGMTKPPADSWRIVWLILAGSVAIKLALILHLGMVFHGDVVSAVNFGYGIHESTVSIRTHIAPTRTWVGPVLWFHLFQLAGPLGLKAFNLLAFLALVWVQYLIGRRFYNAATLLLALFLYAFFVAGHRQVMAGEPDDLMATLLFATGLLVFLRQDRVVGASVLMGLGFLFKFWIAILFGGFFLFIAWKRRWALLPRVAIAFVLPFLAVNLVDGFASLTAFLRSLESREGATAWSYVAWRMFSTGLLPALMLAAWTRVKEPSVHNQLFFLVPSTYLAYMVIFRDAYGTTGVMNLCMLLLSFLIARFLLINPFMGRGRARQRVLATMLAAYVLISAGMGLHASSRGTYAIQLRADCPEGRPFAERLCSTKPVSR